MVSAMTNMSRKTAIDGPSLKKNIKFHVTICFQVVKEPSIFLSAFGCTTGTGNISS